MAIFDEMNPSGMAGGSGLPWVWPGLQSAYDGREMGPDRGTHFAFDASGRFIVNLNDETGWSNFTSSGSVNDNQWHMLCATVDRDSELSIYIDGSPDISYNPSGRDGDLSTNGSVFIGGHKFSPSSHFHGVLDDLRMYEGVIDPVRIELLYQAGLEGALCPEQASTVDDEGGEVAEILHFAEQNFPNPFQPATTIRFVLPDGGPVELVVLDVGGRRVRTLASASMDRGQHEVVWDGSDDFGKRLPGGIYFWRLSSGGRETSRKMIMLE